MSEIELPLLDPDVRALLDRVAAIDAAPAGAKGRIRGRIDGLMSPPAASAGIVAQDGAPGTLAVVARSTFVRLLPLAASFAIVAGVGAWVVASRSPVVRTVTSPRIVDVQRVSAAPTLAALADRADGMSPQGAPSQIIQPKGQSHPRSSRLPSSSRSTARSLSSPDPIIAERDLLDGARRALALRDGTAAMDLTERYKRQFPSGVLAQECEAIAIRALVLLDRRSEAEARAQCFGAHFPHSVLLPTVKSMVGAETR
jgi:hypothetical protein